MNKIKNYYWCVCMNIRTLLNMKLRTAIVFDLHKQLPGKMKQYSEKENVEFLQKLNPWKSKKILKKRYSKNCSWRKKKGAESLENYENRKKLRKYLQKSVDLHSSSRSKILWICILLNFEKYYKNVNCFKYKKYEKCKRRENTLRKW